MDLFPQQSNYTEAEREIARKFYYIDASTKSFQADFLLDRNSLPRKLFDAFVDTSIFELTAKKSAVPEIVRDSDKTKVTPGKALAGDVVMSSLFAHALHYSAQASVSLTPVPLSADSSSTQGFFVELPWLVPDLDIGYEQRNSQTVVLSGSLLEAGQQTGDVRSMLITVDDEHHVGKGTILRLAERVDPTQTPLRRIDGTVVEPFATDFSFFINNQEVMQMSLPGVAVEEENGRILFRRFTSPAQARGAAVLLVTKLLSFLSIWRVTLAALQAVAEYALLRVSARGKKLKITTAEWEKIKKIQTRFQSAFEQSDEVKFHVNLKTLQSQKSAAIKAALLLQSKSMSSLPLERQANVQTVADRIAEHSKVAVRSFQSTQKLVDDWEIELSSTVGLLQRGSLDQIGQKILEVEADEEELTETIDMLKKAVLLLYRFIPSIEAIPEPVKRLHKIAVDRLNALLQQAVPIYKEQMSEIMALCEKKVAGLDGVKDILMRAGIAEEDRESLTAAVIALISDAYLDQPGNNNGELATDDSAIVALMKSFDACLSSSAALQPSEQKFQQWADTWRKAIKLNPSEGEQFALEPRGQLDRNSFGARARARVPEANRLLLGEILRVTGPALSYTTQIRRRLYFAVRLALENKYNLFAPDKSSAQQRSEEEVWKDLTSIFNTVWQPLKRTIPTTLDGTKDVPEEPKSLARGQAQILLQQIDALMIKMRDGTFASLPIGVPALQPGQSAALFDGMSVTLLAVVKYLRALIEYYISNGEKVTDLSDDPDILPQDEIELRRVRIDQEKLLNQSKRAALLRQIEKAKEELPVEEDRLAVDVVTEWTQFEQKIDEITKAIGRIPSNVKSLSFNKLLMQSVEALRMYAQNVVALFIDKANDNSSGERSIVLYWIRALAALRAAGRLVNIEKSLNIGVEPNDNSTRDQALRSTERVLALSFAQRVKTWVQNSAASGILVTQTTLTSEEYADILDSSIILQNGGNGQVPIPDVADLKRLIFLNDKPFTDLINKMLSVYADRQRSYFIDIAGVQWSVPKKIDATRVQLDQDQLADLAVQIEASLTLISQIRDLGTVDEAGVIAKKLHGKALEIDAPLSSALDPKTADEDRLGYLRAALSYVDGYFRYVEVNSPIDASEYNVKEFELMQSVEKRLIDTLNRYTTLELKLPERVLHLDDASVLGKEADDLLKLLEGGAEPMEEEQEQSGADFESDEEALPVEFECELGVWFMDTSDDMDVDDETAQQKIDQLYAAAKAKGAKTDEVLTEINAVKDEIIDKMSREQKKRYESLRTVFNAGAQLAVLIKESATLLDSLKTSRLSNEDARKRGAARLADQRALIEEIGTRINNTVLRQPELSRVSLLSYWRKLMVGGETALTTGIEQLVQQLSSAARTEFETARAKFRLDTLKDVETQVKATEASILSALKSIESAARKAQENTKDFDKVEDKLLKLEQDTGSIDKRARNALEVAERIEKSVGAVQEATSTARLVLQGLNPDIQKLDESTKDMQKELTTAEKQLASAQSLTNRLPTRVKDAKEKLASSEKTLDDLLTAAAGLNSRRVDYETKIDKIEKQVNETSKAADTYEKKVKAASLQIESANATADSIPTRVKAAKASLALYNSQYEMFKSSVVELTVQQSKLDTNIKTTETQLNADEKMAKEFPAKIASVKEKLQKTQDELARFNDENSPQSISALLQGAGRSLRAATEATQTIVSKKTVTANEVTNAKQQLKLIEDNEKQLARLQQRASDMDKRITAGGRRIVAILQSNLTLSSIDTTLAKLDKVADLIEERMPVRAGGGSTPSLPPMPPRPPSQQDDLAQAAANVIGAQSFKESMESARDYAQEVLDALASSKNVGSSLENTLKQVPEDIRVKTEKIKEEKDAIVLYNAAAQEANNETAGFLVQFEEWELKFGNLKEHLAALTGRSKDVQAQLKYIQNSANQIRQIEGTVDKRTLGIDTTEQKLLEFQSRVAGLIKQAESEKETAVAAWKSAVEEIDARLQTPIIEEMEEKETTITNFVTAKSQLLIESAGKLNQHLIEYNKEADKVKAQAEQKYTETNNQLVLYDSSSKELQTQVISRAAGVIELAKRQIGQIQEGKIVVASEALDKLISTVDGYREQIFAVAENQGLAIQRVGLVLLPLIEPDDLFVIENAGLIGILTEFYQAGLLNKSLFDQVNFFEGVLQSLIENIRDLNRSADEKVFAIPDFDSPMGVILAEAKPNGLPPNFQTFWRGYVARIKIYVQTVYDIFFVTDAKSGDLNANPILQGRGVLVLPSKDQFYLILKWFNVFNSEQTTDDLNQAANISKKILLDYISDAFDQLRVPISSIAETAAVTLFNDEKFINNAKQISNLAGAEKDVVARLQQLQLVNEFMAAIRKKYPGKDFPAADFNIQLKKVDYDLDTYLFQFWSRTFSYLQQVYAYCEYVLILKYINEETNEDLNNSILEVRKQIDAGKAQIESLNQVVLQASITFDQFLTYWDLVIVTAQNTVTAQIAGVNTFSSLVGISIEMATREFIPSTLADMQIDTESAFSSAKKTVKSIADAEEKVHEGLAATILDLFSG